MTSHGMSTTNGGTAVAVTVRPCIPVNQTLQWKWANTFATPSAAERSHTDGGPWIIRQLFSAENTVFTVSNTGLALCHPLVRFIHLTASLQKKKRAARLPRSGS